MEFLLWIPVIQWVVYTIMIISAWRAYHTGLVWLGNLARWSAAVSCVLSLLHLASGQWYLVVVQLAVAWSCWQLSQRVRPALRRERKILLGPDDILDSGL